MTTKTAIKPFREITPEGELLLNFHPGQAKGWRSDAQWLFIQCGTGFGKTTWGPHWLDREMDRRGPGDYQAVTAAFPLLRQKMLPELRMVFEILFKKFEWKAADRIFDSFEKLHGAPAFRIIVGSASSPGSLESGTMKASWLDECAQEDFLRESWEAIVRRNNINEGRILGTTTLYEIAGWYKSEIYDPWLAGDPKIEIIQGDSTDNPAFPVAAYDDARARLPSWKFNMFYRGIYEKPAGLIYDSFDETICKIPRFKLDESWPRYVGHDFGPNNTAAVWYAQDPGTGYLFCYRAYHEGGLSNHDHAQKWKQLSVGENILNRVGGARVETGFREACTAAGWPIVEPREFGVEAGINIVYGWHQQNKLFVFDDVHKYLDEKLSYTRVLDENYEATEKISDKARFHLMDAERYILSHMGPERANSSQKIKVVSHQNARANEERPADFSELRSDKLLVKRH